MNLFHLSNCRQRRGALDEVFTLLTHNIIDSRKNFVHLIVRCGILDGAMCEEIFHLSENILIVNLKRAPLTNYLAGDNLSLKTCVFISTFITLQ